MTLPADLGQLRTRGARHGIIRQHRGLRQLARTPRDMIASAGLTVAATAAWLVALPLIGRFWAAMFRSANDLLDMGFIVTSGAPMFPQFAGATLPRIIAPASEPSTLTLVAMTAACIVVIAATKALPPRLLPLSYWIRALAIVELTAVAFFALSTTPQLPNVADATLAAGAAIAGLVPLLFGLTLYLFDPSLRRGAITMALCMAHLAILLPLQYLLQVALISTSSQLLAPACFLALGPALNVMVVVAFYGWAMGHDTVRPSLHPAGIS